MVFPIVITLTAISLHIQSPWNIYVRLIAFILASLWIFRAVSSLLQDPYGNFHLKLNRPVGCTENTREWLNMGFWQSTGLFPEACKALAMRVIEAAHCQEDGVVLDVGHACGESLLLHLSDLNVPRPRRLVGITSLYAHSVRAREKIQEECILDDSRPIAVHLHRGDAVWRPGSSSNAHPLNPCSEQLSFTSITALDCAYHFRTRAHFLRSCYERLDVGGTLALADLYLDTAPKPSVKLRLLSIALSVPTENMWTKETYLSELTKAGFNSITFEDVTSSVFPGFRMFLRSRGTVWAALERWGIGSWVDAGGRYAIVSCTK